MDDDGWELARRANRAIVWKKNRGIEKLSRSRRRLAASTRTPALIIEKMGNTIKGLETRAD